jgi:predicted AAA+ superfamily ATPase
MKRKLLDKLLEWKQKPKRKPLILEGARQVGKTYLLRDAFAAEHYKSVAYLNLQNPSPEVKELFEGDISPKRIISQLELLLGVEIEPAETLIILDEIQEVPRALTSLKYFYEEAPEYHVAVAGSLLGVFLHQGASFPVGKVETLRLEPMDFEEFLWANGKEKLTKYLHENVDATTFDGELVDLFREYSFTGGMPDVVKDWVQNHDINNAERIQQLIISDYRGDFGKHADATTAVRIRQVFDSLPSQFAKNNDKFVYGVVKEGARAREYELAIEWLVDAGIVRRVYQVERGDKLPLAAYADRSAFKLYFVDIGLFRALADIPSSVVVRKNAIFDEFNGFMAEQFVCQELAKHSLYYWASKSDSEVDFVGQFEDNIVPIEVKSGENVRSRSLRSYRERYAPRLAVRFSMLPQRYDDGLLNVPLCKSWLFERLCKPYF